MRPLPCLLCALLIALAGALPARADMRELPVIIPGPEGLALRALLLLPEGEAPRPPAVLGLHGCAGLFRPDGQLFARYRDWGRRITALGHALLLPDSFGSRGLGGQCSERERAVRASVERRADAVAAARWLAQQSFAGGKPVVAIGWSNGASTLLWTALRPEPGLPVARFAAFYPGCAPLLRARLGPPAGPLLILIGEADDWTPAEPCRSLAELWPDAIVLRSYPGAVHGFDDPATPSRLRRGLAFTARGDGTAHVGTDPEARADAIRLVPGFLGLGGD
ncbi:MAG: dienelactone hydrolase family protein [Rhodovarius sp.]|nr:dienelactone hydrolase family protein [Rhodovarius sp.]